MKTAHRLAGQGVPAAAEAEALPQQMCIETLYRTEGPRLLRYVARRASSQEAPDLVQESFLRFARLSEVRRALTATPQAYLTRIAANLIKDHARRIGCSAVHVQLEPDDACLLAPDAGRQLEARDLLVRLEHAMLRLKPKTREIFLAHRLDGLSYVEIAERTGLSVKGVEKQMSKAIAQIDRMLDRT